MIRRIPGNGFVGRFVGRFVDRFVDDGLIRGGRPVGLGREGSKGKPSNGQQKKCETWGRHGPLNSSCELSLRCGDDHPLRHRLKPFASEIDTTQDETVVRTVVKFSKAPKFCSIREQSTSIDLGSLGDVVLGVDAGACWVERDREIAALNAKLPEKLLKSS